MKPTKKEKRFLELAKRQAFQSLFRHKHGSVLVKGGSVINTAYNNVEYTSFGDRFQRKEYYGTRHSEINCILGLDRSVTQGSTLYVVRINNKGDFLLSKPCEMCIMCSKFCGIKKIIYSIDNEHIGKIRMI